jgi:predicted small lipoprotein YifL
MKNFLVYAFVLLILVSCGFKGPLYLPPSENTDSTVKANIGANTDTDTGVTKTRAIAVIKNNI